MVENLPGVKRYQRMFDSDSGYSNISAETYKNVVTDLV